MIGPSVFSGQGSLLKADFGVCPMVDEALQKINVRTQLARDPSNDLMGKEYEITQLGSMANSFTRYLNFRSDIREDSLFLPRV